MGRFAQGKYNLKNPDKYIGNRTPTYRSSWEFAFMKMCDEHAYIQAWASEAVKIPYRNPLTGKHTIYVPDFFIAYVRICPRMATCTDHGGTPCTVRPKCFSKPSNRNMLNTS